MEEQSKYQSTKDWLKDEQQTPARPDHYRKFGFEVWDMLEKMFGTVRLYSHLQLEALTYQMRVGHKEGQTESDMAKVQTLFAKMRELEQKNPALIEEYHETMRRWTGEES